MVLLVSDGWVARGRTRHGIILRKQFPGESRPLYTVVPDKSENLPDGTLGAILSVRQTRLGRNGLQELMDRARG